MIPRHAIARPFLLVGIVAALAGCDRGEAPPSTPTTPTAPTPPPPTPTTPPKAMLAPQASPARVAVVVAFCS